MDRRSQVFFGGQGLPFFVEGLEFCLGGFFLALEGEEFGGVPLVLRNGEGVLDLADGGFEGVDAGLALFQLLLPLFFGGLLSLCEFPVGPGGRY